MGKWIRISQRIQADMILLRRADVVGFLMAAVRGSAAYGEHANNSQGCYRGGALLSRWIE